MKRDILQGATGLGGSGATLAAVELARINFWLGFATGVAGFVLTVYTIISMRLSVRIKRRQLKAIENGGHIGAVED